MKYRQSIYDVITADPGFEINLFDMLYVYRLEDGQYCVCWGSDAEVIFKDPWEAVDAFLKIRNEREIGFDFESEIP